MRGANMPPPKYKWVGSVERLLNQELTLSSICLLLIWSGQKREFVRSGQTKPKVYPTNISHSSETSTLLVTTFLTTDPWYRHLFSKCTLNLISWQYWKSKRFYFTKMRDLSRFQIRCTMYITMVAFPILPQLPLLWSVALIALCFQLSGVQTWDILVKLFRPHRKRRW